MLDAAVRNCIASGITYAVAAGNQGADASTHSPARVSTALTVAATTDTGARASCSDHGPPVDLFAPPRSRAP
ncbi:S8 family serine peptidase [Streptomyces sp. NPDC059456]|uniref:S8 family serine peptidase n=1 Tax=Streptomyces sp. NPDC059456 TaxID=3346838 RepID=UPI0036A5AEB8